MAFYMLNLSRSYSTQHKETQWKNNNEHHSEEIKQTTWWIWIMWNWLSWVIRASWYYHSTQQKKRHDNEKTSTQLEIKQTTWMNNVSGFRGVFTDTKGTPIKKILETKQTAWMNIVISTTQSDTTMKKPEKTDDVDEKR